MAVINPLDLQTLLEAEITSLSEEQFTALLETAVIFKTFAVVAGQMVRGGAVVGEMTQ